MRFLFFALYFCFCGCQNDDDTMIQVPPPPLLPAKTEVNFLALGDSYTIGESVGEKGRFPNQFVDKLRAEFDSLEYVFKDDQVIAQTGWRTDQLQAAINDANLQDTFDLVSLLIGVNNQFQGRPLAVYRAEFTDLLNRAIELAGGNKDHIFVLSIPDYAFTPFGQNSNPATISAEIDDFNAANREITEMMGVRYFDITPISRKGLDEPELVANDGLHPSTEQYRRWVELFFDEVVSEL